MSTITIDDVDARLFEAEAATSRTKSAVKRNVTIFTIANDLRTVSRRLKQLADLCNSADLRRAENGMQCQHIEKRLGSLIGSVDQCRALCKSKGLYNRTFTAGQLRSIDSRLEDLKDMWVALSCSTDFDLDEALKAAKSEESMEWESLWR